MHDFPLLIVSKRWRETHSPIAGSLYKPLTPRAQQNAMPYIMYYVKFYRTFRAIREFFLKISEIIENRRDKMAFTCFTTFSQVVAFP